MADFRLEADVDVNAAAAAKELEDSLSAAIANALKDQRVRAGAVSLAKEIAKELHKIPKTLGDAFNDMRKQSARVSQQMANDFKKVGTAAKNAASTPVKNPSIATLERSVAALADNLEESLRLTRQQVDLLVEMGRQERAAARLREQGNRTAQQELTALNARLNTQSQRQAAIIRQAGQIATATIRGFFRVSTQIMRSLTRVFEVTWRSAERFVRGFVRSASTVLRGLQSVVTSTFRVAGRAVQAFGQAATRVFATFGRGVGRALAGVSRAIASALRRDEHAYRTSLSRRERDLQSSLGRQARAQQRFSERQRSGILGGLGLGAGLAGGAGLVGFLTSGFERAGQEESLQLQFQTLLQDGDAAARMLQQISDFARTTRFDFVEVAGSVAQLTAAFGDVDRAFRTNKFLADLVSLTGGGTSQFSAARLAFSQIAATGRLEGQELNQLLESIPGVPIVSILADRFFGGDQAAFQEARRNGELGGIITSDAFFEALEAGARERFPEIEGFAQRVGQSLGGLADNLRENFAIFGAQVIGLVEGPLKRGMNALNNFLAGAGAFITGELFERDNVVIGSGAGLLIREDEGLENLRKLRDTLGDMVKSVGIVLGLAASFKILRLAMIGLTSPLGLVVGGAALGGGLLGRLIDASPKLQRTLKVLRNQIGPTVAAFAQFFRLLGGAAARALFGEGKNNIFTRIGDSLIYAVKYIARGVVAIRHFVNTLSLLIAAGRADLIDDVIIERLVNFSKSVGELLGEIFNIDQADIDAEGGGIAGFLRNTFLEPVVNFFTETVPNALGGIPSFFSGLFNAIFGGDEEGGLGAAFRGEEGDSGGIGTRILNVIEDTILGPVVRFFRGPFADGVESAIGFVVDVFRGLVDGIEAVWRFLEPILDPITDAFRDFFTTFREGGFLGALGSLGRGLLDTVGNIGSSILSGLQTAADTAIPFITEKLDPVWTAITGWFTDTFTLDNLIKGGDFFLDWVYAIGNKIGEVLGDPAFLLTILAAIGAIGITIGNFFLGIFTGLSENAGQWGDLIVSAINSAIGGILPDDITDNGLLSSAIGIAVSGAVIAGLAIAGAKAFKAGKGPGAGGPGTGSFSLATLGFSIAGGLFNTIKTTFQALWQGGTSLFSADRRKVLGTDPVLTNFGRRFGAALVTAIGVGIAGYQIGRNVSGPGGLLLGILTGGLAGASIGAAIGGVGAPLGAVLGAALGGITALFGQNAKAAAEARDRVNEYVTALQGITPGAAAGVLTSTLAQQLTSDVDALDAWGQALIDSGFNLNQFSQDVIAGTAEADVAFSDFLGGLGEDLLATGEISQGALDNVLGAFRDAALSGEFTNLSDLLDEVNSRISGEDYRAFNDALEAIDFTGIISGGGDAEKVFGFLNNAVNDVGRAFQVLNANAAIGEDAIDTVAEAVTAINDGLRDGDTAQQIFNVLNQDGLSSADQLTAIEDAANGVRDAIDDALDSYETFLDTITGTGQAKTAGDAVNEITAGLPAAGEQLQRIFDQLDAGEITPTVGLAQIDLETDNIRDQIADALAEGARTGTLDTEEEIDAFLRQLQTNVDNAGLPDAAREQIQGVIDEFQNADYSTALQPLQDALTDQATLERVTRLIQLALFGGGGGGGGAPLVAAREFGGKVVGEIAAGIQARGGEVTTALEKLFPKGGLTSALSGRKEEAGVEVDDSSVSDAQDVVRRTLAVFIGATAAVLRAGANLSKAFTDGFRSGLRDIAGIASAAAVSAALAAQRYSSLMYAAGVNIANALASGILSRASAVASAAAALASAAIFAARSALQIASPSKVFENIGENIGEGFIKGIKDTEGDLAAALDQAISGAIERAQNNGRQRAADAASAIFGALIPSFLPGGTSRIDVQNARAGINAQLGGFLGELGSGAASALGGSTNGSLLDAIGALQSASREFRDSVLGLAEERAEARRLARLIAEAKAAQAAGRELTDEQKQALETPLTARQKALIANLQDLSGATEIGSQNRDSILQALDAIQSYGQAALESGASIDSVIQQMTQYRDELIAQAKALGFNSSAVQHLIDLYGLSDDALADYQASLLSLDITTAAGSGNVQNINEQLLAIREFGAELLAAGLPASTVAAQLRALRDQLIKQATAFGFNAKQIAALVEQAGLSEGALADFIAQMLAFQEEAQGAGEAARKAAEEAAKKKAEEEAEARGEKPPTGQLPAPIVGEITVNVPYGDPEAVALAVANRVAYDAVTSW